MNQVTLRRGSLALAAMLAAAPLAAMAQQAPAPPPVTGVKPASPQSSADQRIQALRAQLHITDAQNQQWNAFAEAMRQNAASTDALFRKRASAAATMNALENMQSYAQVARAYADNTQALATAFEALYDVLSAQQKQTADALFRQDAKTIAQRQQSGQATQPGHY
jgi:periplasmic protein CpxP/Spy